MIPESKLSMNKSKYEIKKNKVRHMAINENNAFGIAERIAFPRLIGSEGEKKALGIILDEFRTAGYNPVHRDKFKTSFYNWVVLRYLFIPISLCVILMSISFYLSPWLTLGFLVINIYISTKALGLATTSKIHLFKNDEKNYTTENVHVKLKSKNSRATVIFMAHWDSKSQTFSSSKRIIIFMISVFGYLTIFLLYLVLTVVQIFMPFNNRLLNDSLLYVCMAIAIVSNLNYFNKTGDYSPGALDNAAGVGALIELARYFKKNPIDNIDKIFLCPSSEELNLGGAKHFIQNHKHELDKETTFFINFDFLGGNEFIRLISSYGIPRKVSSKKLKKLFFDSAKESKINIKDVYLPTGAWSDYMPIVQEGYEACWLGSHPGLKYIHTKEDKMNLVSKDGIKNVLLLSLNVVDKLNREYY